MSVLFALEGIWVAAAGSAEVCVATTQFGTEDKEATRLTVFKTFEAPSGSGEATSRAPSLVDSGVAFSNDAVCWPGKTSFGSFAGATNILFALVDTSLAEAESAEHCVETSPFGAQDKEAIRLSVFQTFEALSGLGSAAFRTPLAGSGVGFNNDGVELLDNMVCSSFIGAINALLGLGDTSLAEEGRAEDLVAISLFGAKH